MIFLELFWTFFKIGAFTFGGGYAMLPLIQEAVLTKGWGTPEALINFIAVSESTPGPFAINMATYIGAEQGGILGAFCATLGVVTPSFIIILLVAKFFDKFKESKIVKGCMYGLKPAVIGLIGAALLSVAATVFIPDGFTPAIFTDPQTYLSLAVFGVSAFLAFRKTHPIAIICLAAGLGILGGYIL